MTIDIPESQAIDAGLYPATLTKLEVKTIEKGAYAGDTIRIWTFAVDVNGTTEKVDASSSLAFGSKSKAYRWFNALVGRPPVFGEKGVQLAGLPCQLMLVIDEDSGYNKVADVLPAKQGQKVAAATVAAPSASDDGLPPMEEPPLYSQEDMP